MKVKKETALENAKKLINIKISENITILDVYQEPKQKVKATYQCSCGTITKNSRLNKLTRGEIKQCKKCSTKKASNSERRLLTLRKNAKYNHLIGEKIHYFTVLRWATKEDTKYTGRFICQCCCGNIRIISGNELLNTKDRKSCGCMSAYSQSITNGGTGILYENTDIRRFLREIPEYSKWVKTCLLNSNYTCFLSNIRGTALAVHHIAPLSRLIKFYKITKENYKLYSDKLFDTNNGVVLQKQLHIKLHSKYGNEVSMDDIIEYRDKYYPDNLIIN